MDKMKFESPDMTAQNIDRIAALFPNCVTEALDEEHSTPEKKVYKRAVNFELLKQMLSPDVVDGDEAYEFTWVGKKAAIVEANKPIRKTLRPCVAESKDWDTTENLYIEGDNLEVLKLLQESYLGKVKMIYIDPPYNTGHDFVYRDNFQRSQQEENARMGMFDENENRLFENTESNGRFHSDWCSMMYSRLLLARNILSDDGVIFISIGDEEVENLRKIADEVFGEANFRNQIIIRRGAKSLQAQFATWDKLGQGHEYILFYTKNSQYRFPKQMKPLDEGKAGGWNNHWRGTDRPTMRYELFGFTPDSGQWRWSKDRSLKAIENYERMLSETGCDSNSVTQEIIDSWYSRQAEDLDLLRKSSTGKPEHYIAPANDTLLNSSWMDLLVGSSSEIGQLFDTKVFDTAKLTQTISRAIKFTDKESVILDFFSGSATTAHAVMQLNAEDGGHRKFIMVQLPEKCDEASEAYKAGYKNICEIGKERIRRAGEKIKSEIDVVHKDDYAALVQSQQSNDQKVMTGFDSLKSSGVLTKKGYTYKDKDTKDISRITYSAENPNDFYRFHPNALDVGFRVLKLDDSNMKDVYYAPNDYDQGMLAGLESNIKDDRTDLDLLFGCLIDWGLPLSLPYKSEKIDGCTVHTYNDGDLIACFDANIPESVVKEIAQRRPLRAVFRDSGFASSPEKINVFEIFKLYMPEDAGDISKRVRVI